MHASSFAIVTQHLFVLLVHVAITWMAYTAFGQLLECKATSVVYCTTSKLKTNEINKLKQKNDEHKKPQKQ